MSGWRTRALFFLFFLSFTLSPVGAATSLCLGPTIAPEYLQIQKHIQETVDILANHKEMAGEADLFLEKLSLAKSPMLLNWIQKRKLNPDRPEELVKQWRRYYFENFLMPAYKKLSRARQQVLNQEFQRLSKLLFTKERKQQLETTFKEALEWSFKFVEKSIQEKKTKEVVLTKLKALKLYWFRDLDSGIFAEFPQEFLAWGVAYSPKANAINMGVQALKYPNEETLFAVFAHEIGHALDSCRWSADFPKLNSPFAKIYSCLRQQNTVQAKPRDDQELEKFFKAGKLSQEQYQHLKANPTCNLSTYPPEGIQKDQLPEAFADWFSAEVVALSKKIGANLRSDLCEPSSVISGSSYLSNEHRLEKIYLRQPQIRQALDLKNKAGEGYCPL